MPRFWKHPAHLTLRTPPDRIADVKRPLRRVAAPLAAGPKWLLEFSMQFRQTALILFMVVVARCALAAELVNDAPRPAIDVPFARTAPKLDGSPEDPAWTEAAAIPGLELSLGNAAKGLKPVPTAVRLLWDDSYLYVRFLCEDSEMFVPHTGRDANHYEGDVAEVFLDPVGDQRQYFELQVSPDNGVLDQLILVTGEPRISPSLAFDWGFSSREVWFWLEWTMDGLRTATGRLQQDGRPAGWVADLGIPAKPTLRRLGAQRFSPEMALRINFLRYDRPALPDGSRAFIATNWAPVLYGCPHVSPAAMGKIVLRK